MNIVLPFILLVFYQAVLANEKPIELNSDNLTLLALKYSPPDVLSDHVLREVKTKHTKQYYKIRKQPEELAKLIEKVRKEVELSLSKISRNQLFRQSTTVSYGIVKEPQQTIQISDLSPNISYAIFRSYKINKGLPDYFKLLIANLEILDNIKVNGLMFEELKTNHKKSMYVDVIYRVTDYQNEQYFQAVVQDIKLYKDPKKTNLITELKEQSENKSIIENWLLAEGFSTKLVGIHAFSVLGYRLQDEIRKSQVLYGNCKKAYKINTHRVLICEHRYTENSIIIAIYIGGILAQMDLLAESGISQDEKDAIVSNISQGLNNSKSKFTRKQKSWTKYAVDFNFLPLGFEFTPEQIKKDKLQLVFSMSSHATNKIFEGH